MKNLVQKQKMRIAGLCLAIGMSAAVGAQTTVATGVGSGAKNSAQTNVSGNKASVRVVDNKGTVKYLQANNGLTQIVNTTGDVTTTTWQLGGTLTDNTYIDATGKVFALDGLTLASSSASTNAVSGSKNGDSGTATGFTLLVRDEATGAVQKLLVSDLVKGGKYNVDLDDAAKAGADLIYVETTLPLNIDKVSVYRNGVKLVAGVDYDNTTASTAGSITVKKSNGTDPNDYAFAIGDRIEVQWIK